MIPVDSTSSSTVTSLPPPDAALYTPVAQTTTPAAQPAAPTSGEQHLDDAQVEQAASDILDVGKRTLWSDDYDARAEAFSALVDSVDDDTAARLFAEVLDQDPGALNSWLQADRLQNLNADGRISDQGLSETVDAFATAYMDGAVSFYDGFNFIDGYENTLVAPALNAESFAATDALLAAGDPATMDAFRAKMGEDILRERVTNTEAMGVDTMLPAAYAMHLLDQVGPTAIADTLEGFNAADRQTIYDAVANGGIGYVNSQGVVPGLEDPMASLIESVAASDNGEMAVELARYAETANDDLFFDWGGSGYQDPLDARAEALGDLVIAHGDTILDALTQYDTDLVGSDGRVQQVGVNGVQLGNLLRLTALNPDAANQTQVLNAVTDYAAGLRDTVLTDTGTARQDAIQSLAVLGAAAQDGVNQAFVEADRAAEARQQFADFVVDLALAGIPFGSSDAAKALIGETFGSAKVQEALQGFTGQIIDSQTGQLTDGAKKVIADALGEDLANAQEMTVAANNLINDAILSGLGGDDAASIIRNALTSLPDRIDEARKR